MLNQKQEEVQRKRTEAEAIKENLEAQIVIIDKKKDELDKLQMQEREKLEALSGLSAEKRYERLDQLFGQQPPAVIVCRSEELEPFPEMLELAKKHGVALLRSNETTCTLMGSLISVLNLELAPRITRTVCWWKCTAKAS